MTARAGYATPLLHVSDVRRSIRFYQALGFELVDIEGPRACFEWARLHCEGGAVMLLRAERVLEPARQSILLYTYAEDLPALREALLAAGLAVPEIQRPEHMPSGELRLVDPDGYVVLVGQWSAAEHEPWEARRRRNLAGAGFA